jgi:hypothetical protein
VYIKVSIENIHHIIHIHIYIYHNHNITQSISGVTVGKCGCGLPKLGLDLTQSSAVLHLSGVRFKIIEIIEALLVGGFKHFLFSIIYGTILPIDFYIFQKG